MLVNILGPCLRNRATCAKSQESSHTKRERYADLQPDIARSRSAPDVIPASIASLISAFVHRRKLDALAMYIKCCSNLV